MIDTLFAKVFGTKHDREVKRLLPMVAEINELSRKFSLEIPYDMEKIF